MRNRVSPRRRAGAAGSILSIGSSGSILSIGSTGSILSIGSAGSILSIGSAGSLASAFSVGSLASAGSIMSGLSLWSILAWRSARLPDIPWLKSLRPDKALPAGASQGTGMDVHGMKEDALRQGDPNPGLMRHFGDALGHGARCAQRHVRLAKSPGQDGLAVAYVLVLRVCRGARALAGTPVPSKRRAQGLNCGVEGRVELILGLGGRRRHL